MLEQMKKFNQDTKGGMSILWVIIVLVAVILATGFMNVLEKAWTLNEAQSIMDIAGVSALQAGVDQQKLRVEIFDVDEHVVKNKYEQLIHRRFADNPKIVDYRFIELDVEKFEENWGLGQTSKPRRQAVLKNTMFIVIENVPTLDLLEGGSQTFYDARSSADFTVTYIGETEDGHDELLVRSVTRVVYR